MPGMSSLFGRVGALFALSTVGGLALAGYVAGGDLGRIHVEAPARTALGGNPDSLVADSYGEPSYLTTSYARGELLCQGCGPGISERRAEQRSAAHLASLERYEEAPAQPLSIEVEEEWSADTLAFPSPETIVEEEPVEALIDYAANERGVELIGGLID